MLKMYKPAMILGISLLSAFQAIAADGMLGVEIVDRGGQVVITRVFSGSSAESVGIQPGDILVKVGTKNINSVQDALDAKVALNNNEDVPFLLMTSGGLWPLNARFEKGTPFYKALAPRPSGKTSSSEPAPRPTPRPKK